MSGKLSIKELAKQWCSRRRLTLAVSISLASLIALLIFAMLDFGATARQKDQQLQAAGLKGELAQFILALREDDGLSILENTAQLSRENRPLSILTLSKPFFTYFLQRANAHSFNAKNIKWDPPRACVLEFSRDDQSPASRGTPFKLQACFAVLPADPAGRYIYFSLRYPDNRVIRHREGTDVLDSDRVSLILKGNRIARLELVFQPTRLAESRYPSQHSRFSAVHEVTAYWSGNFLRPLRAIKAQAYERSFQDEIGSDQNYVTILGRIDSSLLLNAADAPEAWPPSLVNAISIGVSLHNVDADGDKSVLRIDISPSEKGRSVRSLERLYASQVLSKAHLELTALTPDGRREKLPLWKSSDLTSETESMQGTVSRIFQKASDWWAQFFFAAGDRDKANVTITQNIVGRSTIEATLRAESIFLPDIATRLFLWLTLALGILVLMVVIWIRAFAQLQTITRTAYIMTVKPRFEGGLNNYSTRQDEIGTLARTFSVLLKRTRSRSARIGERIRRDEQRKSEEIKSAQENVKTRQSILGAIGHEIKSPLQSLVNKIADTSELRPHVERMRRAVDALYEATSIEAAFKDGKFAVKLADIARFLHRLASNYTERGHRISYVGPTSGISAAFDAIALDTVCGHILDNAIQRQLPGSDIQISLVENETEVCIDIFNYGQHIPDDQLELVFDFGYSAGGDANNRGLGLFVSRIYTLGMRGTIKAENRANGVAIVVTLPATLRRPTESSR